LDPFGSNVGVSASCSRKLIKTLEEKHAEFTYETGKQSDFLPKPGQCHPQVRA
jgi:hypothetical protein